MAPSFFRGHRRLIELGLSADALVDPLRPPITLPNGKKLVTLKDAAAFILKLSKAEQSKPHWQAAAEAVIMAAEDRGPLMHADIGTKRALNAGKPVEFDPKQKSPALGETQAQEGRMKS